MRKIDIANFNDALTLGNYSIITAIREELTKSENEKIVIYNKEGDIHHFTTLDQFNSWVVKAYPYLNK